MSEETEGSGIRNGESANGYRPRRMIAHVVPTPARYRRTIEQIWSVAQRMGLWILCTALLGDFLLTSLGSESPIATAVISFVQASAVATLAIVFVIVSLFRISHKREIARHLAGLPEAEVIWVGEKGGTSQHKPINACAPPALTEFPFYIVTSSLPLYASCSLAALGSAIAIVGFMAVGVTPSNAAFLSVTVSAGSIAALQWALPARIQLGPGFVRIVLRSRIGIKPRVWKEVQLYKARVFFWAIDPCSISAVQKFRNGDLRRFAAHNVPRELCDILLQATIGGKNIACEEVAKDLPV